jgi:hypothetical protein
MVNWKDLKGSGRGIILRYTVLSYHSPGGIEENYIKLSQDNLSPGWGLNMEPPEYKAGVIHN